MIQRSNNNINEKNENETFHTAGIILARSMCKEECVYVQCCNKLVCWLSSFSVNVYLQAVAGERLQTELTALGRSVCMFCVYRAIN